MTWETPEEAGESQQGKWEQNWCVGLGGSKEQLSEVVSCALHPQIEGKGNF